MKKENSEDYLDSLLDSSINAESKNMSINEINSELESLNNIDMESLDLESVDMNQLEGENLNLEDSIYDEFENTGELFKNFEEELSNGNVEGFLRDFENEISNGNAGNVTEIEASIDMDLLNNLDNLVQDVSDNIPSESEEPKEVEGLETEFFKDLDSIDFDKTTSNGVKDEVHDISVDSQKKEEVESKEGMGKESLDEKDILEWLDENLEDEDLADISELLKKDENNELIENPEDITRVNLEKDENNLTQESTEVDSKENMEKEGLLKKLLKKLKKSNQDEPQIKEEEQQEEVIDENLKILQELEKEEKAEKKSNKKKKEKRPKVAKEKKAKKEKIKKPKKKKPEVVSTPSKPLPKIPVILMLMLGLSMVILTMTITVAAGYDRYTKQAKAYYEEGKYRLAYEQLQGLSLQSSDMELYEKVQLLSWLEKGRDSYYSFSRVHMYAEALDSLVKGVECYDEEYEKSESFNVQKKFQELEDEIETLLMDTFGIDADKARELRAIEDKVTYTRKINEIIIKQGLVMEKE